MRIVAVSGPLYLHESGPVRWVNDQPKPDARVPSYASEREITVDEALPLILAKLRDEIDDALAGRVQGRVEITATEARLLAARLAEAERQRDEALASVVLYVNERDAARDGWEAQVRSEEREMRRRIEAEARADNLAPYVMRSQAAEARVAALTAWAPEADELREAVLRWSGESSESERHMGRDDFAAAGRADDAAQAALERADEIAGNMTPLSALAAADRPEATTPQEGNA